MCGILGYFSTDNSRKEILEKFSRSMDYLKYRGPDNLNIEELNFSSTYLLMGHTRLSIIDLKVSANQPMYSASGNSVIVFNGEIYNYKKLKDQLLQEGAKFLTNSDTEVILSAYESWGIEKTLNNLDGMFAFGIFDIQKKILITARDRFGKKPLYFYTDNNNFIFSSDIRSVKQLLPKSPTISHQALGYYFSELATPEEDSIWNEIKKVKPGHYLSISKRKQSLFIQENIYWDLKFTSSCNLSRADIIEKSDFLLSEAVKKRLVSDVRVSAFLSGGIDSSLVVAKMSENSSNKLNTYTVGYSNQLFDESKFAKEVSDLFQTNHTEIILEPSSFYSISNLLDEFGEPFADSSMIPTYLISKEVSKQEKVVLGGDGGDELFAGYNSYYMAHKYDQVKKFKHFKSASRLLLKIAPSYRTKLLNDLLHKSDEPLHRLLNRNMGFSNEELKILILNNKDSEIASDIEHQRLYNHYKSSLKDELTIVMNSSIHTRLVNDYLVKVDRSSMYASLEMRTPFLDKDLAIFASTLKPHQLYHKGEPKSVLKELASRYFSKKFIYRNKMGFGIPLNAWFKKDLIEELKAVIVSENKYISFNLNFVEQLIEEHRIGSHNHTHKLWALYVFNIWASRQ